MISKNSTIVGNNQSCNTRCKNDDKLFQEAESQSNHLTNLNRARMEAIFDDRNTEIMNESKGLENTFPVNFENGVLASRSCSGDTYSEEENVPMPFSYQKENNFSSPSDDTVYIIPERSNLNPLEFQIDPLKSENNTKSRHLRECNRAFKDPSQFFSRTDLQNDSCKQDYREAQSVYGGNYQLANYSRFRDNKNTSLNVVYNNPTSHFQDGHGPGSCQVSVDSYLRQNPKIITSSRHRTELPAFNVNAPNKEFGRGTVPPEESYRKTEDFLQKQKVVRKRTPYNEKYEKDRVYVDFSRYIEPQIPTIAENIQKPENIIQESAKPDFIRGGYMSRNWLHDQVITYNFNRLNGQPYKSRPEP